MVTFFCPVWLSPHTPISPLSLPFGHPAQNGRMNMPLYSAPDAANTWFLSSSLSFFLPSLCLVSNGLINALDPMVWEFCQCWAQRQQRGALWQQGQVVPEYSSVFISAMLCRVVKRAEIGESREIGGWQSWRGTSHTSEELALPLTATSDPSVDRVPVLWAWGPSTGRDARQHQGGGRQGHRWVWQGGWSTGGMEYSTIFILAMLFRVAKRAQLEGELG